MWDDEIYNGRQSKEKNRANFNFHITYFYFTHAKFKVKFLSLFLDFLLYHFLRDKVVWLNFGL